MELLLTLGLCFCFSLLSGANAPCSAPLKNIAVREGDQNTLFYYPADPNDVQWTLTPTSDELTEYPITDPSVAGQFALGPSGLTVLNATTMPENGHTTSTAGLYTAICANQSEQHSAKLVVVRSGPTCSCSQGNSSTNGDLSCSVIFADSNYDPIHAVMIWYRDGVYYSTDTPDTPTRTNLDQYSFIATSKITVSDSATYTCAQSFSAPMETQSPNLAMNAPEFTQCCSTSGDCSVVCNDQWLPTFTKPKDNQYPYNSTNAQEFNESCSTPVCWEATTATQASTITSTTAGNSPTTATSPYTTGLQSRVTIKLRSTEAVTTTIKSVTSTSKPTATTMAVMNVTQSVTSSRPTTITTAATTTQSVTTSSRSTTTTKATFNFLVDPAFGPIAGGTKVAVTDQWSELHGNISVVYFGSNLLSKNITRSGNNVRVITPPTDASAVGQSLPISVEIIPGSFNVSINKSFTYAPNPEVQDVNPKVLTLSGGMRLTVTGGNLSSVAKPLIRVLVAVKRGDGSSSNNESFAPCEPATEGGTQRVCLSPPIYIPDDFLDVLFGSGRSPYTNAYRKRRTLFDSTKTNSRRKRQAQTELYTNRTYSGKNELDKLSIYIGAVFDGYSKYIDDILRDNPAPFGIFFPPTLTCPAESEYDPNTDDFIKIKGEGLSRCCNADSYIIHLGNDFCNVTELTDNQLTCKPPKTKPEQTQSDIVYCDQNIAIFVNLGYRTYKCSCLKYTNSGVTKLITIIVATVGSSLVFFIVIILASVIIKKVKNSKKTYHQDPQVDETRGRRGIVLRSWQSEPDGPGLTSDDNSGDIPMGQDEYRSYINPSEGDSYRGASYNGGYARDIGGNDHQDRHSISDDHDDYLERDDRGNWKEDSSKGRRTDNE